MEDSGSGLGYGLGSGLGIGLDLGSLGGACKSSKSITNSVLEVYGEVWDVPFVPSNMPHEAGNFSLLFIFMVVKFYWVKYTFHSLALEK